MHITERSEQPMADDLRAAALRLAALLESVPHAAAVQAQIASNALTVQALALRSGLREPLVKPGIFLPADLPSRVRHYCRYVDELRLPRSEWFRIPGESFGDVRVVSLPDDLRCLVDCGQTQRLPRQAIESVARHETFATTAHCAFHEHPSEQVVKQLARLVDSRGLVNVEGLHPTLGSIATVYALLFAATLITTDAMKQWNFDRALGQAWDTLEW